MEPERTLFEGIECWAERKAMLSREDVINRATETLKLFAAHGIQYVRTHVDVTDPSLTALKAILEVREQTAEFIDLQIVAFPQEGILSFRNGQELMEEAVRLGADVVGGIPHFEFTRDYGTRVTASHTCAMGSYNDAYCSRLFLLLKKSGLRFLSMPTESLHLQSRFDGYPKRRGLTRVPELLEAGLKVAFGQDSIRDPWYPIGNGNMLRTLDVGLHACHMLGMSQIEKSLELITDNGAAALNLQDYGIEEGRPARCIVQQGQTPYEVLMGQQPVMASVRDGKLLIRRSIVEYETTLAL